MPQRRGRANVSPNKRTVGFNETITYSCPSGYIIVRRSSNQFSAICTSSGRFSPDDLPQCRGKNVDSYKFLNKTEKRCYVDLGF